MPIPAGPPRSRPNRISPRRCFRHAEHRNGYVRPSPTPCSPARSAQHCPELARRAPVACSSSGRASNSRAATLTFRCPPPSSIGFSRRRSSTQSAAAAASAPRSRFPLTPSSTSTRRTERRSLRATSGSSAAATRDLQRPAMHLVSTTGACLPTSTTWPTKPLPGCKNATSSRSEAGSSATKASTPPTSAITTTR